MVIVTGKGATSSELPTSLDAARTYFSDIPAFILKIEAVDQVKPLGRPGAYLITHHPVGGLGCTVVMAACLQAEWHEGGLRLRPLDFEPAQVKCDHPIVKGYIEADLALVGHSEAATAVDFAFSVSVELPLFGPLKLFPQALVRTTADGIMAFKVGLVIQSLFQKVLDDFGLSRRVPAAAKPSLAP